MKIRILLAYLILPALAMNSCSSAEEKSDEAYENAKLSKEYTDDSLVMETEEKLVPLLATKPMKVVVVDPLTNYMKEVEKELKLNERMILDLRKMNNPSSKENKRISSLEKDNLELQTRIVEYRLKASEDLEKFKLEMKTDMIELSEELQTFPTTK